MRMLAVLALLVSLPLAATRDSGGLARHVVPLGKALACPPVVVDASAAPSQAEWGEQAKAVVLDWFGPCSALLATEGFTPPAEIRLVIAKQIAVPAYTSGATITIDSGWVAAHPDDLGMVVHELVHVLQAYPPASGARGWLTEGIADYIRWWRFEPEEFALHGRPAIDPARSRCTDGYRTTAYWLAWTAKRYDLRLVRALDAAMRRGEDPMPLFAQTTGRDADALWAEFLAQKP